MRRFLACLGLLLALSSAPANAVRLCSIGIGCGGVAPVLDLNFLGGSLPPVVSFSRASTASYFNSSGVLTQAASGAPRFDYNPSTLALNGLLIEQQSTNLALQSEAFGTTWTTGASTVTSNTTVAPDGTKTADTITDTAVAAVHYVVQNIETASGSTTYTASAFFQAGTLGYGSLVIGNVSNADAHAVFTLSGGGACADATVGSGFSSPSCTVTEDNSGWYRATLTATAASGQSVNMQVGTANGAAASNYDYTGTGSGTVVAWGAQFEKNIMFATSYIPTTTATVTRAADVATVATSAFAFNAAAGSLAVQVLTNPAASPGNIAQTWAALSDGSTNNDYVIGEWANSFYQFQVDEGATTPLQSLNKSYSPAGSVQKACVTYVAGAVNFYAAGALQVNGAVSPLPSGITTLNLGVNSSGSAVGIRWLQKIRYWPRVIPASLAEAPF